MFTTRLSAVRGTFVPRSGDGFPQTLASRLMFPQNSRIDYVQYGGV
jgi:hypothetical protein